VIRKGREVNYTAGREKLWRKRDAKEMQEREKM
jgi:hypothetical protein